MKINPLTIHPKPGQGVYVFQFPIRLWHWTIFACIFIQFITGHFIGQPPQTLQGDATKLFYFGMLIKTHYIAGMILCVAMLYRIFFAFVGNPVSRQIFIPHIWEKAWWKGLLGDIKWYLFIDRKPDIHMGHNPLAQAAMFLVVWGIIFMCLTGLGIYQAKGYSDFFKIFSFMEDWVYATGGNLFDLVLWHRMGMIVIVVFVWIHIYMVIREDIMGRTTIVSTMISGVRLVKSTPLETLNDLEAEDKIPALQDHK